MENKICYTQKQFADELDSAKLKSSIIFKEGLIGMAAVGITASLLLNTMFGKKGGKNKMFEKKKSVIESAMDFINSIMAEYEKKIHVLDSQNSELRMDVYKVEQELEEAKEKIEELKEKAKPKHRGRGRPTK